MVDVKEAYRIAKERVPEVDWCEEYSDLYLFFSKKAVARVQKEGSHKGGKPVSILVVKETGQALPRFMKMEFDNQQLMQVFKVEA